MFSQIRLTSMETLLCLRSFGTELRSFPQNLRENEAQANQPSCLTVSSPGSLVHTHEGVSLCWGLQPEILLKDHKGRKGNRPKWK